MPLAESLRKALSDCTEGSTLSACSRISHCASFSASAWLSSGRGSPVTSTWKGKLLSAPVVTSMTCCLPASIGREPAEQQLVEAMSAGDIEAYGLAVRSRFQACAQRLHLRRKGRVAGLDLRPVRAPGRYRPNEGAFRARQNSYERLILLQELLRLRHRQRRGLGQRQIVRETLDDIRARPGQFLLKPLAFVEAHLPDALELGIARQVLVCRVELLAQPGDFRRAPGG